MESSEYKTSNPFSPWLTEDEVEWMAYEIDKMMKQTRYGAVALVFIDGKLETMKSTISMKPPRNGEL